MERGDVECEIQQGIANVLNRVGNQLILRDPFSHVISKVDDALRGVSSGSFNPKVVSIGPLHRDNVNVEASQRVKTHYMNILLSRSGDQREVVREMCEKKVRDSLEDIKKFYPGVNFSDDAETVRWLCEDAFFILGFCVWFKGTPPPNMPPVETIMHDLVLLENQIPLFVLDEILKTIAQDTSLVKLLLPILSHNNLFKTDINIDNVSTTGTPHILGLLHQCYKPRVGGVTQTQPTSRIRSSVVLKKSGVNFKPNQITNWMMEIKMNLSSFGCLFKPTLRMPVLCVDSHTELVLWNLIEYEREYASLRYIISYAWAMFMLLTTHEDVALMFESGVLHFKCTHSHKQVVNMFNNIFKNFTGEHSFYEEQWITMNKYYDSWAARLWKNIKWAVVITILGLAVAVASLIFNILKR